MDNFCPFLQLRRFKDAGNWISVREKWRNTLAYLTKIPSTQSTEQTSRVYLRKCRLRVFAPPHEKKAVIIFLLALS